MNRLLRRSIDVLLFQPELQKRLRAEIHSHLGNSNGELTYDLVKEMVYLHMVVSGESLIRITCVTQPH